MLATYASALVIVLGSVIVGRALMRALGQRETSWIEPVAGFALLLVVASAAVRVLDGGLGGAIALAGLIGVALLYLRFRVLSADDLRLAAVPLLLVVAVASLPLLASLRVGILGVGVNNDLASHLLWADWLIDQDDPQPSSLRDGYPIGPHALAASVGDLFGFAMTQTIVGLLIAVAALTALTALGALRQLSPARRALGAALVALPYLTASALAVGGFKETTMGLLFLGFVVGLLHLERTYPGDRALLVALGVIAAGALSAYSYPGLYWLIAAAGLLSLAAVIRAVRRGGLEAALRGAAPVVLIPAAVALVVGLADLYRANQFRTTSPVTAVIEGDGKLRETVSPLEALGSWPDPNFLAGTSGPPLWPLFGALGLLALALATPWWLRRRSLAVPLAVLGATVIYLGTLLEGGLYVQSKALAVPASVVMLLIVGGLLSPAPEPRPQPRRRVRAARLALAGAFAAVAALSSFLALRDAVVAPTEHADELSSIRAEVAGEWTLSLTNDRFTDYQLRSTMVASPDRNAQQTVPARSGKDFRLPIDFDSIAPEALDFFDWVLVTGAGYRSAPPSNLELAETTDSYELWRRTGPTPLESRVFGEQARPGKVLRCRAEDLSAGERRRVAVSASVIDPRPAVGKRGDWEPSSLLRPGESATQVLRLPPGRWSLSLQYQSPIVGLSLEAGGESFELPAAMDGAVPFRLGEGPFWPAGEIDSEGGPVEVTVRLDEASAIQRLLGVRREAAIGNVTAVAEGSRQTVPFRRACERYVDHYFVPEGFVQADPEVLRDTRNGMAGRYRGQTPEQIEQERREELEAGDG